MKLRDLKPGDKFFQFGKQYQAIVLYDVEAEYYEGIVQHYQFTDHWENTHKEDRVYALDLQTFRVVFFAVNEEIDQKVEVVK